MLEASQPSTGDLEINNRRDCARAKFAQLRQLLTNNSIQLHIRLLFLDAYVKSRLTYGCQGWAVTKRQSDSIDVCYRQCLRRMIRGGFRRASVDGVATHQYHYSNADILRICQRDDVSKFVAAQQQSFLAHVSRYSDSSIAKKLLYNADRYHKFGPGPMTLQRQVLKNTGLSAKAFHDLAVKRALGSSGTCRSQSRESAERPNR